MKAVISIFIGLSIIFVCYQIIKREFEAVIVKANSKYGHISDENTKKVISNLEGIENTVNELNRSFYEMVSELEGKISIHDKEIEIITDKFEEINKNFVDKMKKISVDLKENKKAIKANSILKRNMQSADKESNIHKKEKSKIDINVIPTIDDIDNERIYIETLDELEKEKLRDTIVELRHKGFSINQIAKKLGVGVGELQLVLNLHRK